jgi:very-short-patch-repair endonuclease
VPTVKEVLGEELKTLAAAGWTAGDIANHFDCSPATVRRYAKEMDIKLAREKSYGQLNLRKLLATTFPGYLIQEEYGIGERLRLDFYIPELMLGFEYDGSQHEEYSSYFHGDVDKFVEAKARDQRKEELCSEQGIKLVRVNKDNPLTQHDLHQVALDHLDKLDPPEPKPKKSNGNGKKMSDNNGYYKELRRKQSRERYRRQKEFLKNAQARIAASTN